MIEPKQIARYGLVGIASNLLLYCVYLLALRIGLTPTVSMGTSFVLGAMFSFVLNRTWTFTSQGRLHSDLIKFLIAYGAGFLFAIIAIDTLTRWISPELAALPNIILTAMLIYILLRYLKFGKIDV